MNPTRRLLMTSALVALIAIFIRAGVATAQTNATLANRNANPQTQALYRYLTDLYGTKIIAGQQESTWMGSENYEFEIIYNASGKLPAIRGLDYMNDDFRGVNRRAQEWFKRGGIVTICWHCGADFRGSHRESLRSNLDWENALSSGTPENKKLLEGMDKAARALAQLQDEGVTVLWRPFHEFDGAWFWWGKGGPENFKKLWRIMFERYTNEWKLNNLIWVLGYCGEVKPDWYPGDEYVDIVGADTYVKDTGSLSEIYKKASHVANGKPVCLHENGPIPDPEALQRDGANWLWFMTWHTSFIDRNPINTTEYVKRVYNSEYVVTLDELPDVYRYDGDQPN